MNIYVGNISYSMTEKELGNVFSEYGEVSTVKIICHRDTGASKGFGFVEMPDADEASKAIETLNNFKINGRFLRVNEAKPRENFNGRKRTEY